MTLDEFVDWYNSLTTQERTAFVQFLERAGNHKLQVLQEGTFSGPVPDRTLIKSLFSGPLPKTNVCPVCGR